MNNNINYKHTKLYCLLLIVGVFLLSGCSQDEDVKREDSTNILVPIEISSVQGSQTKSIENQPYTVDRILILPFKKINESIVPNEDSNFAPDYTAAKQINISSNPVYATMLSLSPTSTYKVLAIGYNRNDYDSNTPASVNNIFSIGSVSAPTLLSNIHLNPVKATVVSEFFTAVCQSYNNTNLVGEYFTPGQINNLKGNMTRLVSGLNLEITNIPAFVTSVTLVAEQLVKAVKPIDATATLWQTSSDADNVKTLGVQAPVSGNVSFNKYLLPTFDLHKTKLFLDIKYGGTTERYTVVVPDLAGVSSANSIILSPNQVVKISGNYANINLGFTINNSINLDDDAWDGLQ